MWHVCNKWNMQFIGVFPDQSSLSLRFGLVKRDNLGQARLKLEVYDANEPVSVYSLIFRPNHVSFLCL